MYNFSIKSIYYLRPASNDPQFMQPVMVNRFPTPDLETFTHQSKDILWIINFNNLCRKWYGKLYVTRTARTNTSALKSRNHGMPAAPTQYKPVVLNILAEGSQI